MCGGAHRYVDEVCVGVRGSVYRDVCSDVYVCVGVRVGVCVGVFVGVWGHLIHNTQATARAAPAHNSVSAACN